MSSRPGQRLTEGAEKGGRAHAGEEGHAVKVMRGEGGKREGASELCGMLAVL